MHYIVPFEKNFYYNKVTTMYKSSLIPPARSHPAALKTAVPHLLPYM